MKVKLILVAFGIMAIMAASADVLMWQVNSPAVIGGDSYDWAYAKIYSAATDNAAAQASAGTGTALYNIVGEDAKQAVTVTDFSNYSVGAYLSGTQTSNSFWIELFGSNNERMAYSNPVAYNDLQSFVKSDISMMSMGSSGWANGGAGGLQPVPEPTSGLLVLIGAALVGLRRKKVA